MRKCSLFLCLTGVKHQVNFWNCLLLLLWCCYYFYNTLQPINGHIRWCMLCMHRIKRQYLSKQFTSSLASIISTKKRAERRIVTSINQNHACSQGRIAACCQVFKGGPGKSRLVPSAAIDLLRTKQAWLLWKGKKVAFCNCRLNPTSEKKKWDVVSREFALQRAKQ